MVGQSYNHPIVPLYYIEDFRILRGLKNCRKFEVCLFVERQKIDVKDKISFPYLRMILHLLLQFFHPITHKIFQAYGVPLANN